MKRFSKLLVLAVSTLLLGACGSNDNSPVIIDIDDSGETNTDTGTRTETLVATVTAPAPRYLYQTLTVTYGDEVPAESVIQLGFGAMHAGAMHFTVHSITLSLVA